MAIEGVHADSLRWMKTGAASHDGAQPNANDSIGNYKSNSRLQFLGIAIADAIANLTVDFAAGENGLGTATLQCTGNDTVKYTPPNGTAGPEVTILNGETRILEGGDDEREKFIQITRDTADPLSGTATLTFTDVLNNVFALDNVDTDEAAAGSKKYRCFSLENISSGPVKNIKCFLGTLGTDLVSGTTQLPASGAGTIKIATGTMADWPVSGFCKIKTSAGALRENVYYTDRTVSELTVPAAGRELLGTTASAGLATDKIYPVCGVRIGKEAPTAQPDGHYTVIANEDEYPGDMGWLTGLVSDTGLDIGNIESGEQYGVWIEREVPVGYIAETLVYNFLMLIFEAT